MPVDPFNTRTSLIADACAGKSEAIDDFCRFYKPLIINRLKSSKGLQTADAEDVAQEVLMFLVSCLPKFEYDPSKTFRGFISKILSYKTFEHWRGSKKAQPSESVAHRILADKHSFQDILELLCENERKLHAEIILKEAKARAIKRGFHESTWQAWEGVFLKNKDYPTLANEMSLPESTLYAKVYRLNNLIRETARDLKF